MYPNIPQDQQPLPADYLNQIAPIQRRNNDLFGSKKFLIFGLIAALIIILILTVASSIIAGNPKDTEILAARLVATKDVAEKATNNIKNSQLRAINSSLKLFLTNTIRDIKPLLAKVEVDIEKLSDFATTSESNTALQATLEDARLNAVYDRAYAREMAYKLDTILSLSKQIYGNTSSSELKNFLITTYDSLAPTQKLFADFNASNS
jgi:hypothetical protein